MKLEIGNKEKPGTHKHKEIKTQSFQQSMGKEGITREIRKYLEMNENGTPHTKTYLIQQNSAKREGYSSKCLHLRRRKLSNEQPNIIPQGTRKRREN